MAARRAAVSTRTVRVAGRPVLTMVTARPGAARRWVRATMWRFAGRLRSAAGLTVGLGVQWTPPFRAVAEPQPGTLQLCAGSRCLVFQLARAGAVPALLRRFLADERVTFAGYNVASDCRKLHAHHGLEVASTMELRRESGMGGASMARMAATLLGIRGVEKPAEVGRSEWDAATLSKKQVRYACVDAYLSCRLGVRLRAGDKATLVSDDDDDDSD
ncbi:hypothetical protein ACP70R_015088 [Stipagrostis hirtigluma subsp. patula]